MLMLAALVFVAGLVCSSSSHAPLRVSFLRTPLIGGPSFLPIHHVAIIYSEVDENEACQLDFLPLNPLQQETTLRLITLQSVGELLCTVSIPPKL